MYKTVLKRRERRAADEELGIAPRDDSDSDESRSDSEPDSMSDSEVDDELEDGVEATDDEEAGDDDDDDSVDVREALATPIQSDPESEKLFCLLCPGKVLKEGKMAATHQASASHARRLKRIQNYVSEHADDLPSPASLSRVLRLVDAQINIPTSAPAHRTARNPKPKDGPSRRERRAALQKTDNTTLPTKRKRERRRKPKGNVDPTSKGDPQPTKKRRIEEGTS